MYLVDEDSDINTTSSTFSDSSESELPISNGRKKRRMPLRLTQREQNSINKREMQTFLENLSGSGMSRQKKARIDERTPSIITRLHSRRSRVTERTSSSEALNKATHVEERELTPPPTKPIHRLEERSITPPPRLKELRVHLRRLSPTQLEERLSTPSPPPIRIEERVITPPPRLRELRVHLRRLSPNRIEERSLTPPRQEEQISNVTEERSPSPYSVLPNSYLQNNTIAVNQNDRSDDDVTIQFLNQRSLLNKNIIIKEYILRGSKSTKILIDHMASFLKILEKVVNSIPTLNENDRMQMNIKPKSWDHHISTPIVRVKDFRPSLMLAAIQAAAQSGMNIDLTDDIRLDIRYLKVNSATSIRGGRHKYRRISTRMAIRERRCIVEIANDDYLCLPRAIAVGIAKYNYSKATIPNIPSLKSEYEKVIKKSSARHTYQTKKAITLCKLSGVPENTPCGSNEISQFEKSLPVIIKIIAADQFNNVVYDTMKNSEGFEKKENIPIVYLFRTHNPETSLYHYDTIVNITSFYDSKNFCDYCNVPYGLRHQCEDVVNWCYSCNRRTCIYLDDVPQLEFERCQTCNVRFRNALCSDVHTQRKTCEQNYFCFICKQLIKRKKKRNLNEELVLETNDEIMANHWCGRKCKVCQEEVHPLHKCYLQKTPFKRKSNKYLFLDFETSQVSGEHIPIYCHLLWSVVEEDEIKSWEEKSIGLAEDVTNAVGTFLFSEKFSHYTIIAHNMRGYDGCFLLRYLAENGNKPQIILRNKKILALFINVLQIRIIDSLNFLPMALTQFSKAFNINTTKGYFPHFFSKPETFDYVGDIPDEKMYGTASMKPNQYKEFKKWYEDQKKSKTVFNFREQISFYCKQDVLLLQQGCWVFRELMLDITEQKCDAFQYLTLPSLCNAVYKNLFMPPNSIAAVPPNGYADVQAFSSKSLEWLSYLELTIPSIKHIGNSISGEVEIANMRVDGFDKQTNTVYEFNGCYFHACPKCYPKRNDLHKQFKQTLHHIYKLSKERESRLRLLGYKVVIMWECKWGELTKTEPNIQKFLRDNPHKLEPLDPFKAFFGGRVETFNLLIQNDGRNIKYEDVNSLYPFINATKEYPIGHPLIICNNFGSLSSITTQFFGFVYCKVKTPRNLYIPVLPGKYGGDGKLIFTLCRTCASTIPRQTTYCKHSDEERALVGVWFTEELKVAERKGYEIIEVYSIYQFEEKSDKLFADYIRTFYKIKILASGTPKCNDMESYIKEVLQRDKIDLQNEQFEDNPSLRSVSKLMLNTLWGKFGTRRLLPEANFCSSIEDLRKLFDNDEIEVSNVIEVHDNMVIAISQKKKMEYLETNNNANIFVAACTTAYARIELYNYIDILKERVVYTDTDCAFYVSKPFNDLPTGDFLGQLKNELDFDDYIVWFVSGGPKNYAYRTKKNVCVYKIKGISLTVANLETFTFENMARIVANFATIDDGNQFVNLKSRESFHKEMINNRDNLLGKHLNNISQASGFATDTVISVYNPCKIKIKTDWKISSVTEHKLYSCLYDKRMVMKDFSTLPFGYCI